MPEPELTEAEVSQLTEEMYQILRKSGSVTYGCFDKGPGLERLKKNAGLVGRHIGKSDLAYAYRQLEQFHGVRRRSGAGTKDTVYEYKEIGMQTVVPDKGKRRQMAEAMVAIVMGNLGKPRLSIREIKHMAAEKVGYTFAEDPPRVWGIVIKMACTKKSRVVNVGGYLVPTDDGKTVLSAKAGKQTDPGTTGPKPLPPSSKRMVRTPGHKAGTSQGLGISVQPNGSILITAPAGKIVQVSSDSPSFLVELGSVTLTIVEI